MRACRLHMYSSYSAMETYGTALSLRIESGTLLMLSIDALQLRLQPCYIMMAFIILDGCALKVVEIVHTCNVTAVIDNDIYLLCCRFNVYMAIKITRGSRVQGILQQLP